METKHRFDACLAMGKRCVGLSVTFAYGVTTEKHIAKHVVVPSSSFLPPQIFQNFPRITTIKSKVPKWGWCG